MLNATLDATHKVSTAIGEAIARSLFGDPKAKARKDALRRQRLEEQRQRLEEERWQAREERRRREAEVRQEFLASKSAALASLAEVDFDGDGTPDFSGGFQPTLMDTTSLDLWSSDPGIVDLRDKDVDQPVLSPSFADAPGYGSAEATHLPDGFSPTLMDTADLDLSPVGPDTVDLRDKDSDQPVLSPSFADAADQTAASASGEIQQPPARTATGWTATAPAESPRQSADLAPVGPPGRDTGRPASSPAEAGAHSGLPSPADVTSRHARVDFDGDGVPDFEGGGLRDAPGSAPSPATQAERPSLDPAADSRDKDLAADTAPKRAANSSAIPSWRRPALDPCGTFGDRGTRYINRPDGTREIVPCTASSPAESPRPALDPGADSRDKDLAPDTAPKRTANSSAIPSWRRPALDPCGTFGDRGTRYINRADGTREIVPCTGSSPAESPRQSADLAPVGPPSRGTGQPASSPGRGRRPDSGLPNPADVASRHAQVDFDGDGVPDFKGGGLRDAPGAVPAPPAQARRSSVGPAVVDLSDKNMDAPVVVSPSFDEKMQARAHSYADGLRIGRGDPVPAGHTTPQEFLDACGGDVIECMRRFDGGRMHWKPAEIRAEPLLAALHWANVLSADLALNGAGRGLSDAQKLRVSREYLKYFVKYNPDDRKAREALALLDGWAAGEAERGAHEQKKPASP